MWFSVKSLTATSPNLQTYSDWTRFDKKKLDNSRVVYSSLKYFHTEDSIWVFFNYVRTFQLNCCLEAVFTQQFCWCDIALINTDDFLSHKACPPVLEDTETDIWLGWLRMNKCVFVCVCSLSPFNKYFSLIIRLLDYCKGSNASGRGHTSLYISILLHPILYCLLTLLTFSLSPLLMNHNDIIDTMHLDPSLNATALPHAYVWSE